MGPAVSKHSKKWNTGKGKGPARVPCDVGRSDVESHAGRAGLGVRSLSGTSPISAFVWNQ